MPRDLLDKAERAYVRSPLPQVRPIGALRARIRIAQQRLADAVAWTRGLSAADELSYLREFEHMTLAKVLIARYETERVEDSIQEAVRLLERLLKAAEVGGRTGSVIEILVLQAIARSKVPSLGRIAKTRDLKVEDIVREQLMMLTQEYSEIVASREFDRIKAGDWHVLRSNYPELYAKAFREANLIIERKKKTRR